MEDGVKGKGRKLDGQGIDHDEQVMALQQRVRELEEELKGHENREYKSRLFSFIFGREEHKEWTLALYNAINGTDHKDPADITINTIGDVVYMGMKNDLSLLVSEIVSLYRTIEIYEQQATLNSNMPIRQFMYAAKLYDKYLYMQKANRYGKKLIPLPIPKLVCFYNGEDEQEDEVTLRLSDAFKEEIRQGVLARNDGMSKEEIEAEVERLFQEAEPDIEVKVRMVNINYGHNKELLQKCKPLEEYSWFVAKIREYNHQVEEDGKRIGIEAAVDRAVDEMPKDFLIREFIVENRAEVKDMCLTEYNEEEVAELFREEGREEGREQGRENALVAAIKNLMKNLQLSVEQAMDALNIPFEQRAFYKGLVGSHS